MVTEAMPRIEPSLGASLAAPTSLRLELPMNDVAAELPQSPPAAPGISELDLQARYMAALASAEPLLRATARHQLVRLRRATESRNCREQDGSVTPHSRLLDLVERTVGPLKRRPNGDAEGPCPWHASTSDE